MSAAPLHFSFRLLLFFLDRVSLSMALVGGIEPSGLEFIKIHLPSAPQVLRPKRQTPTSGAPRYYFSGSQPNADQGLWTLFLVAWLRQALASLGLRCFSWRIGGWDRRAPRFLSDYSNFLKSEKPVTVNACSKQKASLKWLSACIEGSGWPDVSSPLSVLVF